MGQNLEMVWFGLGLAALGGMAAFLFWFPSFEEQGGHRYADFAFNTSQYRYLLLFVSICAVVGGLVLAVVNFLKYLR